MATLREQFLQSKKSLEMARDAVSNIAAELSANLEYRAKKAIDRERVTVLNRIGQIFSATFSAQCPTLEHFRERWATLIPMASPVWDEVQSLEARLENIDRMLAKGMTGKCKYLLGERSKAKKVEFECDAEFKKLRDLDYRDRQKRQAAKPARNASQSQPEHAPHIGAEAIAASARRNIGMVTSFTSNPVESDVIEEVAVLVPKAPKAKKPQPPRRKTAPAGRNPTTSELVAEAARQIDESA